VSFALFVVPKSFFDKQDTLSKNHLDSWFPLRFTPISRRKRRRWQILSLATSSHP